MNYLFMNGINDRKKHDDIRKERDKALDNLKRQLNKPGKKQGIIPFLKKIRFKF